MIIGALILGFVSSMHCIGMCGPIALMLPVSRTSKSKKIIQILLYNFGRLTTYIFLGYIFGLFGKALFLAGFQQKLSIFLGILMIVVALISNKTFSKINLSKPIYKIIQNLKNVLGKQFKKNKTYTFFVIGILNGLLPCALIYIALFGAIAAQNPNQAALYMLNFGLGTLPLMLIITWSANYIKNTIYKKIQKVIPIFIILLGLLFIIRGLGLSIPYFSPGIISLIIGANVHCY